MYHYNTDQTIQAAICVLPCGKKLESRVYYNNEHLTLSPQEALIKDHPNREGEIKLSKYCKWTMHLNLPL